MADIIIQADTQNTSETTDAVTISGVARCTGMAPEDTDISWQIVVAIGTPAATINEAIKDAAIAAAEAREYTVGALDAKTLLGPAIDLVL